MFIAMHWLMIGLLVSLAALLSTAAGVARHIWIQRDKLRGATAAETTSSSTPGQLADPAEYAEHDLES
jgi:hypothetical protein